MKTGTLIILLSLAFLSGDGQSFINGSLENWASPTVCETNTPPDGWSDYSNVGIGPDEANFTLCPTTIPPNAAQGMVYARCLSGNPMTGEGMYQILSGFIMGTPYIISYQFCGSNRWGGSGDCVWHLFIDDIDVNQSIVFSSSDTVWHTNSYTFLATHPAYKIGVRAYTPTFNGGGSAAIDLFMIEATSLSSLDNYKLAAQISIGPNPFTNTLNLYNTALVQDARFILMDITGQVVLNETITDNMNLNTEQLSPALYYYQIESKGKLIQRGKVVKR